MQTGVNPAAAPPTTWFTVRRMRAIGNVIWTIDLLLAIMWFVGGIYISVFFNQACMRDEAVFHFLILIHFALWAKIDELLSEIQKEEMRFRDGGQLMPEMLPYEIYAPRGWAGVGFLSTAGDAILLTWGCLSLVLFADAGDTCQMARAFHIAFDSVALFVSLMSVLWFILYACVTLTVERHANYDKIRALVKAAKKEKQRVATLVEIPVTNNQGILRQRRRQNNKGGGFI